MKRYITRVGVLLLAGMLVSCGGGGGDSPSGGGAPVSTDGGSPATTTNNSGSPAAANGGSSGTTTGGTPNTTPDATTGGTTPGTTTGGGTPDTTAGGTTPDTTTGGGTTPGTTTGGGTTPGTTTGGGSVGTLPSAGARVEESDPAVTLTPGWTKSDPRWGWSGGAARQSTAAGATASFTFVGTSVRWIGRRSKEGGIALVRVDGGAPIEVDLFSRPHEVRTSVITLYDLGEGQHTLTIEVTGRQNPDANANVVVVDAFEVEPQILSHLQETDPDAIRTAGWVQDDSSNWSGGGVASVPDPPVGGARVTDVAGEKVTLTFRGTSIAWSGYRGPDAGIARVQVDGGPPSEVDTYSPTPKFQEVVFTASGLADAKHTLTIEVTGRKNDASTGAKIVVDAFDVTTPGRRYQEAHAAIIYAGSWRRNVNRSWSEGAVAQTLVAGSSATFSFKGTSVSWIGCQKASIGRARIYIDGAFVREISNFRTPPVEGYQRAIFRQDGLTNGEHTLTIEAVTDGTVVVDGFDVHP